MNGESTVHGEKSCKQLYCCQNASDVESFYDWIFFKNTGNSNEHNSAFTQANLTKRVSWNFERALVYEYVKMLLVQ